MTRTFACVTAAFLLTIGFGGNLARAEWPARVFAPYVYGNEGALIAAYNATGQKYFTLAFTIANTPNAARRGPATRADAATRRGPATRRGGRRGAPAIVPGGEPSFSGHPMSAHYLANDIAFIRSKGGDVIMSFGGADGTEIGMTDTDPAKIEAKYQAVIDEYKLTWLDMDIEGRSIGNPDANHARNTALVNLQKKNPGLIVVYTLAGGPNGIGRQGLDTLRDAKAQGLKVEAANMMTMDYGGGTDRLGKKMGELAIETAEASYKQTQEIDPDIKIGITPDIGINDDAQEIYGLDDAKTVMDWVKDKPYIRLMAFWVLQRDHAVGNLHSDTTSGVVQKDWDFTHIAQPFTVGFTPAGQ